MTYVVGFLIVLLLVLHQDSWLWDNPRLVWGFMPITLLYHAGISVAAGITWFLAVRFCWPTGLDDLQPESSDEETAA